MSDITPDMVYQLRKKTGAGITKCREALVAAHGNEEQAIIILRKDGDATAAKKESRDTKEGLIATASTQKYLAIVEIAVETDFVARNEQFTSFAQEIAELAASKEIESVEQLLSLPHPKDPAITMEQCRTSKVQILGENIKVKRIALFSKQDDQSIGIYTHGASTLVSIVVVPGQGKEAIAKEVAMHVAACSPLYLSSQEVPSSVLEQEKEIALSQVSGKAAAVQEKIAEGKLQAYYKQFCLLSQPFVKDPSLSVEQYLKNNGIAKVDRFVRWQVGGE